MHHVDKLIAVFSDFWVDMAQVIACAEPAWDLILWVCQYSRQHHIAQGNGRYVVVCADVLMDCRSGDDGREEDRKCPAGQRELCGTQS